MNVEQGLPTNPSAERAVLGSILLDNDLYHEAAEKLAADDFALDSHRRIFARISEMMNAGRAVDAITLSDELSNRNELGAIGGVAYLASLTDGLPRLLSIAEYVGVVKEKSLLRAIAKANIHLVNRVIGGSENAVAIIADAENYLRIIADRSISRSFFRPADIVRESYTSADAFLASNQRAGSVGTGWPDFDRMTNKFKPAQLIIVAARPSMGKTAWAVNVAATAAIRQEKHVAIFSLEMSKESLLRRMVCSEARVDSRRFEHQNLTKEDRRVLADALSACVDAPLYFDDTPAITLSEMRAKCHRLKKTDGLDLVVVDYLQLMAAGQKFENRTQEVSAISRGLKAVAKELNVPVIALSQLNRGNESRQDKRPVLSDLRDSGTIEQDADVVMFLHRPEYYDKKNPELKNKAEFILAKQREGPIGDLDMYYFPEFTRFECPIRETYSGQQL
jgi:replicative DNA helicase